MLSAHSQEEVKDSAKYKVIYRHMEKYSIREMCWLFGVLRIGYYRYAKWKENTEKRVASGREDPRMPERAHVYYDCRAHI